MAADIRARIREIKDLLQSGVKSHANDGQTTTFDREDLRRELRALEEQAGIRRPRAKVSNIFLG